MTDDANRHDITDLLLGWSRGDRSALDELMPRVTAELRRLARRFLEGERPNHTLQPTALVNELYLRLVDHTRMRWQDRAHFFAFAARTMRRILVDHARARKTAKRGSAVQLVSLDEARDVSDSPAVDVLALNDALESLAALDERQSRIVELRVFAGLNIQETAEVLDISVATLSRDWVSAKAWLFGELRSKVEAHQPDCNRSK